MSEFNWYPLESGTNATVDSIIQHETNLLIGGRFTLIGGFASTAIAKWNGIEWSNVGSGVNYVPSGFGPDSQEEARVRTIAEFNGDIFIGGTFNRSGTSKFYNIAKLQLTTNNNYEYIEIAGLGLIQNNTITPGVVYKLKVINNELYAAGNFNCVIEYDTDGELFVSRNNITKLVKWNSSQNTWEDYTGSLIENKIPTDITFFLNDIHIEYADIQLNQVLPRVCEVYKNKLYVGGQFININGFNIINFAVTSDKTTWSSVGGGFAVNNVYSGEIFSTSIQSLHVYKNELYVGGYFNRVGSNNSNIGIPTPGIAKWNGFSWSSLGTRNTSIIIKTIVGINKEDSDNIIESLNSGLYVGGSFPAMPGTLANNIALYTDSYQSTSTIGNEGVPCKPIFPCGYSPKQPTPKSANALLIPGPQGPLGPQGPPGQDGLPGLPGQDGSGRDCTVYSGFLVDGATNPLNLNEWQSTQPPGSRSLPKTQDGLSVDTSKLSDCDSFMDFSSANRKMYFYTNTNGDINGTPNSGPGFGKGLLFDVGGGNGEEFSCSDLSPCCSEINSCIPCRIEYVTGFGTRQISVNNYESANTSITIYASRNSCNGTISFENTNDPSLHVLNNVITSNNGGSFTLNENFTNDTRVGGITVQYQYNVSNTTYLSNKPVIVVQEPKFFSFWARIVSSEPQSGSLNRWRYTFELVQPTGQSNFIVEAIEGGEFVSNNYAYNTFEFANTPTSFYGMVVENGIFIPFARGGWITPPPPRPEISPKFLPVPAGILIEMKAMRRPVTGNQSNYTIWFSAPNPVDGTCYTAEG